MAEELASRIPLLRHRTLQCHRAEHLVSFLFFYEVRNVDIRHLVSSFYYRYVRNLKNFVSVLFYRILQQN